MTKAYKTILEFSFLLVFSYLISGNSNIEFLSVLSLIYSFYLIYDLFRKLGKKLPLIELTGAISGLQLLISPFLEYHLFHNEIFGVMKTNELDYFSYMLPALFVFISGMQIIVGNKEIVIGLKFKNYFISNQAKYSHIGFILLLIGILSTIILELNILSSLNFVFVLLSLFKFIGLLYLYFSNNKYFKLSFFVIIVPFLISTINNTIFIDLIAWSIFFFTFFIAGKEVNIFKLFGVSLLAFIVIIFFQSIKMDYRNYAWRLGTTGFIENISIISNLLQKQIYQLDVNKFIEITSIVNVRFNQGWIVSHVIDNISNYSDPVGWLYLKEEVIGIFVPRVLITDKIQTGDHTKFNHFVGWDLNERVSMDLSIMGDGFGAFNKKGGIIFCFFIGLFYGFIIRIWSLKARKNPDILFLMIMVFFYLFRAGNEFYIITNWIVKSSILIYFMHSLLVLYANSRFRLKSYSNQGFIS